MHSTSFSFFLKFVGASPFQQSYVLPYQDVGSEFSVDYPPIASEGIIGASGCQFPRIYSRDGQSLPYLWKPSNDSIWTLSTNWDYFSKTRKLSQSKSQPFPYNTCWSYTLADLIRVDFELAG